MKTDKICTVSFSPTRTTGKVVEQIAAGITDAGHQSIDLTYPDTLQEKVFGADELAIIGVPVYAGRVAPLAARRLQKIKGTNTPAVLVVVYGNREYEDALIELRDLATAASFVPVAATAFIGEHSFSNTSFPIAPQRPDAADSEEAVSFGRKIAETLAQQDSVGNFSELQVPGNTPYKEGVVPIPVTPEVDTEVCTLCGQCVATCPSGAITIDTALTMDSETCIFCCACVKNCPENAVAISAAGVIEKQKWLHDNCSKRKDPEMFFASA